MELLREFAMELGLEHAEPQLIADRSNSVYRIDPHRVVARVAMATSAARIGMDWLRREVELTRRCGPIGGTRSSGPSSTTSRACDLSAIFGEERERIDAMLDAYDGECDERLAGELGIVRNVQVIAWLALFAERQPELLVRMRDRIDRLP